MAEAAITAVLCKLGELAVSEANILLQVGDDIILLRDRLEWLQAVVREADQKRRAGTVDELTRVWVRQTRNVAFEAEDALDDFFYDEVVGPKDQGRCGFWKALCRYSTCLCTKVVVRHGLSGQITAIKSRLDHISENQKEYKIDHTPVVASPSSTTSIAAWRDDLENAVGFDMDMEILMNRLLPRLNKIEKMRPTRHEHSPHDQMPIVGEIVEESGARQNKHPVAISKDGEMVQASGAQENKIMLPVSIGVEIVEASGAQEKKQPVADEEIVELSGAGKNKGLMFISVVGDSGAGKNTLVKIIRREMRPEMQILVWHHMEPGSSTALLIAELFMLAYRQRHPDENDDMPKEVEITLDFSDKLRRVLSGIKYMLILGGISSKTILNSIRASLPDNGGQVILIVDTENEEVAWHANTMNRDGINGVHRLAHLDPPRSVRLFFWKVFRKGQERISSAEDYARYERLVHDITGGHPMAIVLLAGLLRFKERHTQWDSVLQQLETTLFPSRNDGGNRGQTNRLRGTRSAMEIMFWVSFEDLASDLKSCYLYLAAYPKDTRQYADDIVRMWIGEGFIKSQNGKTLEAVGHGYLKELVLRCLVEVDEMKADGEIQLVRVHKSLMGFLQSEVHESGFMEIINDIHDVFVPALARRLSVQSDSGSRYATQKKLPKMRSFICRVSVTDDSQSRRHDLEFLGWSKFIRVISVQGLGLKELPDKIGDMINLRYLRVDCRLLLLLPSSIAKLLNLQTLDIRNTQVTEIHQDFWKIKTLRHVLASNLTLPTIIPVLEEDQSGGGSELQTLHGVRPVASEQWSAGNCPLDKMTSLRSLEMHWFLHGKHSGPAFQAALGNMPLLGHLKMTADEIPSCVFTDPSLRSLQTMVLLGIVRWGDITTDAVVLRRLRPNLVQLTLDGGAISRMSGSMRNQLGDMIFRLRPF